MSHRTAQDMGWSALHVRGEMTSHTHGLGFHRQPWLAGQLGQNNPLTAWQMCLPGAMEVLGWQAFEDALAPRLRMTGETGALEQFGSFMKSRNLDKGTNVLMLWTPSGVLEVLIGAPHQHNFAKVPLRVGCRACARRACRACRHTLCMVVLKASSLLLLPLDTLQGPF